MGGAAWVVQRPGLAGRASDLMRCYCKRA